MLQIISSRVWRSTKLLLAVDTCNRSLSLAFFFPRSSKVLLQDEPVSNLVVLDGFDSLGSLAHREDLVENGADVLLGSELEHSDALPFGTYVTSTYARSVRGESLWLKSLPSLVRKTDAGDLAVDLQNTGWIRGEGISAVCRDSFLRFNRNHNPPKKVTEGNRVCIGLWGSKS